MKRATGTYLLLLVLAACGGDDDATPRDAGSDAASDAAPQACTDNAECDDGLYCNGEERCNDDGVCEREPVDCDDGIECTTDRCSESARACRNTPPDEDGDGHPTASCLDTNDVALGDDCDDNDALRFPGNVESCDSAHRDEDCNPETRGNRDQDGDGFEDELCCNRESDAANAPLSCGNDCDDLKDSVNPNASEVCDGLDNNCDGNDDEGVTIPLYADADRDGHGAIGSAVTMACAGRVGLSPYDDDCDDDDVTRHGAQVEICDTLDNDCDGRTDESPQSVAWFLDADGDGFGDARDSLVSCDPIDGRSVLGTDCDDNEAMVSPRAAEACDAVDNDCSGRADYRISTNDFEDDDGDGVADAECTGGDDCDDRNPYTSGSASEICDAEDNDCDEKVDENAPSTVWYVDNDRDGFGNSRLPASAACFPIPGRTARPGDCDDDNGESFPTNTEWCDAIDNDCDRNIDEDCRVIVGGMDAGSAGTGGNAGTGGSAGTGGNAGTGGGDGGVIAVDAGADAGDAGVGPLPVIACSETTALDGTDNSVMLTVADQPEGVAFCGVYEQRIAIEATRSVNTCTTLELLDVENTVHFRQFGCGTFYVEQTLPGSRPYRVQLRSDTVPLNATFRIWDVPTLPTQPALLDGSAFNVSTGIGQVARFSFDATAAQRITLSSSGPGCRDITLRNSLGVTIQSQLACGGYELTDFTVPATDSYELSSDPRDGAIGQHSFTGWVLGPNAMLTVGLDSSVTVPIALPGNNGSMTFSAAAGQRISIVAGNVGCTDFRLASPTDVTIRSELACGAWFTDVLTLTETGVYTLAIDPRGLAVGSSMVTVHLLAADPTVGATIDGATAMGTIAKPGNNMAFTFSGTSGTRMSVVASGPSCNQFTLLSPTSTSLSTQFACGPWFLDAFTLPSSGTYTITLDPNGAQVGATNATLYALAADPIVAAMIDGVTVNGSVEKPGNHVTYNFTGASNQRISLRATGPGCNTITLFDMNNTNLASQFVCGEWFVENFVLPSTQNYAVRIEPNGSQVGATQLTVYNMPADAMTAATINGATANAVITTPGQNARFTFNAVSGQSVSLHATSPGCYNYTLQNPSSTALIGPTFACGAFNQAAFAITTSGTHTMLLDPSGTATGTATFSVTSP